MNPDTDDLLELCCAEIVATFKDTGAGMAQAEIPADGLYYAVAHANIVAPFGITRALTDAADVTDYNQSLWQSIPFEGFDFDTQDWDWDPGAPTELRCVSGGFYRVHGTGLFAGGAVDEGLFVRLLLDGVPVSAPLSVVSMAAGLGQLAMVTPLAVSVGAVLELQAENIGPTSAPITIQPGGLDRPQLLLEMLERGRNDVGTITLSLSEADGTLVRGIDSIATNDYIESTFGGLFVAKAGQLVQVRGTGPDLFSGLVGRLDVWRIGDPSPWVSCDGGPTL